MIENFQSCDDEILRECMEEGKLHPDFLPFITYDLVQTGYPHPNKGEMVPRIDGGIDDLDRLLPSKGKYCKVEDAMRVINHLKSIIKK